MKYVWLAIIVLFVAACGSPSPPNVRKACHEHGGLPDSTCTPGTLNPQVNQLNIRQTICVRGWTATIRPPLSYTEPLKRQQIAQYGYADKSLASYEEDHFIPLELGGNPTDPHNLWPEPHRAADGPGSFTKDMTENNLRAEVCAGKLQLSVAQHEIATNWETAK